MNIAKSYGVLKDDEGLAFRGLFIIDDKQVLRQVRELALILILNL